jgi:hypothetical protein
MNAEPQPALDLQQLRDSIREEAARKRAQFAAVAPVADTSPGHWCLNWLEVKDRLCGLAELAQAGTPPRLPGARRLRRRLAGLLARGVMRLSRFITSRQTDYNVELLNLVRYTAEGLHDVETRVVQQQEQLGHLETCLGQLRPGPGR